jgi:hypothetical protein
MIVESVMTDNLLFEVLRLPYHGRVTDPTTLTGSQALS